MSLDYIEACKMGNLPRHIRASHSQPQAPTSSKRRSGYEPSDVETDWQDSPQHDPDVKSEAFDAEQKPKLDFDMPRNRSPLKLNRTATSRFELGDGLSPKPYPARKRHNSVSPFKPRRDEDNATNVPHRPMSVRRNISPFSKPEHRDHGNAPSPISNHRNVSPLSKSEHRRHISPYKSGREEQNLDNNDTAGSIRRQEERTNHSPFQETGRTVEKPNFSRRAVTAPRQRARENDEHNKQGQLELRGDQRKLSPLSRNMVRKPKEAPPHMKTPSVGELNEMVANAKISRTPITKGPFLDSTDSFSHGDIFFSRDVAAMAMPKHVLPSKNGGFESGFNPKLPIFCDKDPALHQQVNGHFDGNPPGSSYSAGLSRTTTITSSRKNSSKLHKHSGVSDTSGNGSSITSEKFTSNVKKSQGKAWFACMRKGSSCRASKSPKKRIDEASFIEKAFVVERLRPFWADMYQPGSLNGFTCHKQEAQVLKQTASEDNFPHILLKGPSGSGKRSLAMAFLREIYGEVCWNVTHDIRYFQVQEKRPMQVVVPLTSSVHHVELNVKLEANAKYALMGIVKEIKSNYAITPEVSVANFKADFKVLVLYEVDKAAEHIQHLIKWIMDCYSDACRLIVCCEDDVDILESVKNQCKVLKVDAPVTHEIMEVLAQIARKENFDLTTSFAAKIATKSKQNLRRAIMALEACKAHNYPFSDEQPIPLGWEEVLVELAAEILADPSQRRLFLIRGKFQKLLVDFVHPKLILQKLVEHFLKAVDASIKRELYYWHAYYDKRLPLGATALLKLEEFVAKFMSIYRRSSGSHQFI